MKKAVFIIICTMFALFTQAQTFNQNVIFNKGATFKGRTTVRDTSLYFVNATDTTRLTTYSDTTRLTTTAGGGLKLSKIVAPSINVTNQTSYPFLAGESVTNSGGKTFIVNKSFMGLTVPSIRSGYVGDLTGIGFGNGTTYWNPDSIGAGSLVLNAINGKATNTNAQVIGGAANFATGANSNIIGGLSNSASAQNTLIVNSSASTASDTLATIISSGTSNASADAATIIGSNTCTVSGAVSSIISGASSTVSGRSSGILYSNSSTVSANNSLILNSSDSHIDYDTNGNGNLIAASTLAGIDGNARLSVALGSYKSYQYGIHSLSLGSAYDTTYSYHEIVMGNSAFHDPSGSANSMVPGDIMIGIGNAFDSTEHQNCFIMIKNGNTVIGDSLNIGDKPAPTDAMLRIKGDVKIDSLLSLSSGLDSVTIYALTPANGTVAYCNNCTGSGITGRIVAYIGSAWRRLTFN